MRRILCWFTLVGVLVVIAVPGVAGERTNLSGSYIWERTDKTVEGELDVVLTPGDEGEWTVAFHFDWEGEPHVFEGTAKGSLTGDLFGNVDSDDPGHPLKFEFKGAFSDGTFNGTHGYFNSKGELVDSGTLEFASAR